MGNSTSSERAETLGLLEAEVGRLEARLKEAKASAIALRARVLAEDMSGSAVAAPVKVALSHYSAFRPYAGQEQEKEEKESSPLPAITLAELSPQHTMRRKWKLKSPLPPTTASMEEVYETDLATGFAQEGHLRLFGLMPNGEAWECSIVYSNLMNNGGITIGRDSDYATIVLNDPSVSRCHARLELTDRGVVVTDENSTNGTGINDVMLTHYDRQAVLNDGDILNIADINLIIELA